MYTGPKTSNGYYPIDDYCDCDQRCSKCGKRKRPYGPLKIWTPNTSTSITSTGPPLRLIY